jgi:hypothetical protein
MKVFKAGHLRQESGELRFHKNNLEEKRSYSSEIYTH